MPLLEACFYSWYVGSIEEIRARQKIMNWKLNAINMKHSSKLLIDINHVFILLEIGSTDLMCMKQLAKTIGTHVVTC
jgi:hypothetical protein